jgi:hypothetical protein
MLPNFSLSDYGPMGAKEYICDLVKKVTKTDSAIQFTFYDLNASWF